MGSVYRLLLFARFCPWLSANIKREEAFGLGVPSITLPVLYALSSSQLLSTQDGISVTEVGAALDHIFASCSSPLPPRSALTVTQ